MELDSEQICFVRACVGKWMSICRDLGRNPSALDAWHSGLLGRLLSGKEPLDRPPPLRFSRPDYALAEGEEVEVLVIFTARYSRPLATPSEAEADNYPVVIDHDDGWRWITQEGALDPKELPESGVLEYKDGTRYRFFRKHVESKTECIQGQTYVSSAREGLFLQKVTDGTF